MIIATVDFSTAATDRPAALAQLDQERDRVRAMPGNLTYRIFASREDDTSVTIAHAWADQASFDGYQRSDSFRRIGEVVRPLITVGPVSRRFRAELFDTVV